MVSSIVVNEYLNVSFFRMEWRGLEAHAYIMGRDDRVLQDAVGGF